MSWRTIQAMQGLGQSMSDALYNAKRMKMQREQHALKQQLGNQQLAESQFNMEQQRQMAPLKLQQAQQALEAGSLQNDVNSVEKGAAGEGDIARAGRLAINRNFQGAGDVGSNPDMNPANKRMNTQYQNEWQPAQRYNQNLGPTQPLPQVKAQVGSDILVRKPASFDQQLTGLEVPPGLVNGRAPGTAPPGQSMQFKDRVNYSGRSAEPRVGDQGPGLTQEQLPGAANALNPQIALEQTHAAMDEAKRAAALKAREMGVKEGGLALGEKGLAQAQGQHETTNKLGVLHAEQAAAMAQLQAALKGEDPAAVNGALDALHKVHQQMGGIVGLPPEAPAAAPTAQPDKVAKLVDAAMQDESILANVPPDMEDAVVQELVSRGIPEKNAREMIGHAGGGKAGAAAVANENAQTMQERIKESNFRSMSKEDLRKRINPENDTFLGLF